MSSSMGRMTSHILWKVKKCLKPPTSNIFKHGGLKTKIEAILNSNTKFHGNHDPVLALELSLAAMAVCSSSSFSASHAHQQCHGHGDGLQDAADGFLERTFSGTLETSTDFLEDEMPLFIYIYKIYPNLDTQMMVYGVGGEIFCWGPKIRYLSVLYRETYRDWTSFDQWTWVFNEQIWCSWQFAILWTSCPPFLYIEYRLSASLG